MTNLKSAMIIGAGIGGLVTALQLDRLGIKVQVFESVDEIRALGVGINLLPHSVKVLTELGFADELDREGVRTAELVYYNKFGQLIWQEPRGLDAGYQWPQYSIHRGKLQLLLLQEVRRRLGEHAVQTGHHLSTFEENADGVTAHFVSRKTGQAVGSYKADMMIGADGIHSVVRKTFYPDEGDPKYGGRILWRGTTEAAPFLSGRSMIMMGHVDVKFVAYPISAPNPQGESTINWIAELTVPGGMRNRTDWNRRANKEDFAPSFANWKFDWIDVPRIIEEAESVYEFPLVDKDPVKQWAFGRVALLGDAAHPMYPIGSNGASQAILDSDALSRSLQANESVEAALKQYEALRLEKTASIVLSNRENGPEIVMQIVEERAPNGFANLHDVISRQELEDISARYKKIAGFDRDTLNAVKDVTS
ncbi:flavin-dependent oxidoreductase [Cohnella sp. AR92]|uniref:flavin-dependent oxidoreductase n=1 Tax=Cohnella sp. AR92 TaxID=648716 RepID=UPI000F8E9D0E|nr:flavin-dependent oxidoreductase [Cohnella sp. AR92]RUS48884.1 flavin-dependent oxidoreductase [Cohnella sp. AR92]